MSNIVKPIEPNWRPRNIHSHDEKYDGLSLLAYKCAGCQYERRKNPNEFPFQTEQDVCVVKQNIKKMQEEIHLERVRSLNNDDERRNLILLWVFIFSLFFLICSLLSG